MTNHSVNPDTEKKRTRKTQATKDKNRKALAKRQKRQEVLKKEAKRKVNANKNAATRQAKADAKKAFNLQLKTFLQNPTPSITLGLKMSDLLEVNKRPLAVFNRVSKGIEAKYLPLIIDLEEKKATLIKQIEELESTEDSLINKLHKFNRELRELSDSEYNDENRTLYYEQRLEESKKESAKILSKISTQEKVLKGALNERLNCLNKITSISYALEELGQSNDAEELVNSLIYEELESLTVIHKNFPNSNIMQIKDYLKKLIEQLAESQRNEQKGRKTIALIFNQLFDDNIRMDSLESKIDQISLDVEDIEKRIIEPITRLKNIKTMIKSYERDLSNELSLKRDEIFCKYAAKQIGGVNIFKPVEKNGKHMALKMWETYQDCISALSRIEYGETGQNMKKIAKIFPNVLLTEHVKQAILGKVEWLQHEPHQLKHIRGQSTRLAKQNGEIPRGMLTPRRNHKMRGYFRAFAFLENFLEVANCSQEMWQSSMVELLELRAKGEFVYMNDNLLTKMANNIKPELAARVLKAHNLNPDEFVFGEEPQDISIEKLAA